MPGDHLFDYFPLNNIRKISSRRDRVYSVNQIFPLRHHIRPRPQDQILKWGQESIVRSTLRAIWLLTPDPISKALMNQLFIEPQFPMIEIFPAERIIPQLSPHFAHRMTPLRFRHNVATLCQPRPSAWDSDRPDSTKPQRGGPCPMNSFCDRSFSHCNTVGVLDLLNLRSPLWPPRWGFGNPSCVVSQAVGLG